MIKTENLLELSSDVVFKAFMTSDNTLEYKALLLSEITTIPKEFFKNASYTSVEVTMEPFKTNVVVTAIDNNILKIEINNEYYKECVINNNFNYPSRTLASDIEKDYEFEDEIRYILINFNNFSLDKFKRLVTKFGVNDLKTNEIATDLWTGYFVNVALDSEECCNENGCLMDLLKIFSSKGIEDIRGGKIMDKEVKKVLDDALTELEKISSDEKIVGLYDVEKRKRMIRKSMIETAKEEGLERGIEQGTLNVAKNMLNQGIDLETISKYTNLSIEEIEKLK